MGTYIGLRAPTPNLSSSHILGSSLAYSPTQPPPSPPSQSFGLGLVVHHPQAPSHTTTTRTRTRTRDQTKNQLSCMSRPLLSHISVHHWLPGSHPYAVASHVPFYVRNSPRNTQVTLDRSQFLSSLDRILDSLQRMTVLFASIFIPTASHNTLLFQTLGH
ncbi:hypothetical protein CTAM01_04603 [Colletotrichum tamarilloi]|uniref:Uncharacterized protein n=1 Tax=Colletotrichum tamarilloi TaxID=1209934 RepID=A0ABQ9RGL5_9PEZI|nr:uncharacterized protein CTAM01_04603 [Colletotrichum tamarilloi]KAK1503291.1 hypothetical protein CTAM01_04603 [Colletotrichum tamarilloi]